MLVELVADDSFDVSGGVDESRRDSICETACLREECLAGVKSLSGICGRRRGREKGSQWGEGKGEMGGSLGERD